MKIFLVLIETRDDPSEVVVAYTDKKLAEANRDELNRALRGGFSVAVVKEVDLVQS